MKNKHINKFKVTTYNIDFKRRITPSTILSYMEETATNHANTLGFSYEESLSDNFFWVLRSAKYIFKKIPLINDHIEVETRLAGFQGLKTLREFKFIIDNEVIGYGYNHWLMMDKLTRKPFINQRFFNKSNLIIDKTEKVFKLNRIRFNEDMKLAYKKEIMNNDIDMNYHVNNVKYAEIIFNSIPTNLLEEKSIVSLHIDYLKECKLKDIIDVYYKIDNNTVLVEGRINNQEIFKSIVELK